MGRAILVRGFREVGGRGGGGGREGERKRWGVEEEEERGCWRRRILSDRKTNVQLEIHVQTHSRIREERREGGRGEVEREREREREGGEGGREEKGEGVEEGGR